MDGLATAAALVRRPEGLRYQMVYDSGADDPISRALADRRGHLLFDDLVRLMLALVQPGDVVLDLGAHIGVFSLPAAAAGCRVIAVEPSPDNVALLEASAARNGFRNLEVIAAAVSSRGGRASFQPAGPWGRVAAAQSGASVAVSSVRVDEIIRRRDIGRVAFVKMDVEGSELRALRGMGRLLSRADAPPVLYESNGHCLGFYGSTPNALIGELERHRYRSHLVEPGRLVRTRAGELQPQTVADYIAVKGRSVDLLGWSVSPGLTADERITKLLVEATYHSADHRRYAARVLAQAGPDVLSDRMIARVLDRLREDPVPAVRAAASWWSSPQK